MQEQENKKEQDLKSNPVSTGFKRWLNYQSIVKQVPFFLFLAMLAVIYIYNGHLADKTIRKINQTTKEVKELKYEYISVTVGPSWPWPSWFYEGFWMRARSSIPWGAGQPQSGSNTASTP